MRTTLVATLLALIVAGCGGESETKPEADQSSASEACSVFSVELNGIGDLEEEADVAEALREIEKAAARLGPSEQLVFQGMIEALAGVHESIAGPEPTDVELLLERDQLVIERRQTLRSELLGAVNACQAAGAALGLPETLRSGAQ